MDPCSYPRRILLVATGLTPQVVTETLYGLAVAEEPPWVPTEVHLLTTAEGAERARLTLLSEDPGWFRRLCADYDLPAIHFDEGSIHTIGADGHVGDLRTPGDNEAAADAITEEVRRLTADPEAALHVSLAGGRKTMGFYAGYALSLFGRPQDRLSHVLVSPPFESHPELFYPARERRVIYTPEGRPVDAAEARVLLAEIPFVRLRHGLPEALLAGRTTFSATVAAAQAAVAPPALAFALSRRQVVAGGREIRLPPAELALYLWFAWRRMEGKPPLACPSEGAPEEEHARDFLAAYRALRGPLADTERTEGALRHGMDKAYFLQRRSRLNRRLTEALGPAADPYLLQALGHRPDTRYGLILDPAAIRFETPGDAPIPTESG